MDGRLAMPLVYACIAPHGGEIIPQLASKSMLPKFEKTRSGMRVLAKRIAKTQPHTIVIASPHNLRLSSKIGVVISENSSGTLKGSSNRSVSVSARCDVDFGRRRRRCDSASPRFVPHRSPCDSTRREPVFATRGGSEITAAAGCDRHAGWRCGCQCRHVCGATTSNGEVSWSAHVPAHSVRVGSPALAYGSRAPRSARQRLAVARRVEVVARIRRAPILERKQSPLLKG